MDMKLNQGTLFSLSPHSMFKSATHWSGHQVTRKKHSKWQQLFNLLNITGRPLSAASTEHEPFTASSSSSSSGSTCATIQSGRAKLICALSILFILIFTVIFSYQSGVYLLLLRKTINGSPPFASLCDQYFSRVRPEHRSAIANVSFKEHLHYILRNSEESTDFVVSTDLSSQQSGIKVDYRPAKCSHYSCFDIYRCGISNYKSYELHKHRSDKHMRQQRIKVHVYPNYRYITPSGEPMPMPMSIEFTRILKAIAHSRYYTPNPKKACLYIVNLDLLNVDRVDVKHVEQILWSLPYFSKYTGSNHLLFSLLFSGAAVESHYGIDIGNAMVAGAGCDLSRYRDQFDICLPGYSIFAQMYENSKFQLVHFDVGAILRLERKWTLISTQANSAASETRYLLKRLESINSNQMLLLQSDCSSATSNYWGHSTMSHIFNYARHNTTVAEMYRQLRLCSPARKVHSRYLDMLHSAQFCLILRTTPLSSPLLSDALMSGCIPVILADNLVLPLEQRIDWASVVIRIWEHSTNELMDILNAVAPDRRTQLRINGLHIWRQYFASLESIAVTALDIINERIYPVPRKVFAPAPKHFNELKPQSLEFFSHGYSYITSKEANLRSIGFTSVILSYNRIESLFEVILSVSRAPSCIKIIVVWNNERLRPPTSHWPSVPMPIEVVLAKTNKLSNRFFPYANIETEAIFAIDDDISMLNADEIEFAFQTWKQFSDRIVGFPSRLQHWDNLTRSWQYDSEWKNEISLILTGAAFYNSYYNHLYTYVMPASIRDWVDKHMNCEDIAMNFLVSNITCAAPIKVTPRKKFKCSECSRPNPKLSADAMQHLQMRSKCIDYFYKIYKMMPLKPVEFRASPVLFRDNIPDKLKNFNSIGQL